VAVDHAAKITDSKFEFDHERSASMALWTRRQTRQPLAAAVLAPIAPTTDLAVHSFRGWTESLQITGRIRSNDRLSDALNRREHLRVEGPVVLPIGAGASARYQAPEMTVDPFDLEVVVAPVDVRTPEQRGARRIHKVRYPVIVDAGPFEVHGILHVFAGNAPEYIANHTGTLFFPITEPRVYRDGRLVAARGHGVALVNRYSIRRIDQVDAVH
jgi:hypothetical protein